MIGNFGLTNKNNLRTLLNIVGGIVSFGFIIFLGRQSFSVDFDNYASYEKALTIQIESYHNLLQQLSNNFTRLDEQQLIAVGQNLESLRTNWQELKDVPKFVAKDKVKVIMQLLQTEKQALEQTKQLINKLTLTSKEVNNSSQYVTALTKDFIQSLDKTDFLNEQKNIITLINLQSAVFDYLSYGDSRQIIQIKTKLNKLEAIENNLATEVEKQRIKGIISNTKKILELRPIATNELDLLKQNLQLDDYQKIRQIYQTEYQRVTQKSQIYRILFYLALLASIVWLFYLLFKHLKTENTQLIQVLENFTQELENRVSERTAQLAKSMKEAEDARAKSEEANRAKSRFLASMSHELRTPLNAILGFTQLLNRDNSLQAQHREQLKIISSSGEHLLALINDILQMSKIEAGQINLNENSFDLYDLLRKIEEMFALKAKYQNLKLTFQKETDIPRYIKTDEGKLRQVLINLLSNAFKFTEQGQVIVRISLKKSDKKINSYYSNLNYLHFEVEDTGCGIDEYEIGKLFSPFEQTESGIRSQEGTGLGLPISQKFVQQMGGDITVSSIVGKGSVFAFDISIKLAQATEIPVAKPKKIIGLKDKNTEYRILVVDDIPQGRLLLVQLLSSIGFHVIDAENGEEAVNIWQKWQPHLILMDMRMPVMDGYEATRQIKAKGTETIIIALTASAFQEETAGILAAGCDDFVSKPFEDKLLLHKIAEHLKIDYLYESDKSQAIIPPRSLSANQQLRELSADDLKVMPLAWIIKLHQAANRVNNREIFALIGEITAINSDLATKIANLVHNFRCDYLVTVTESIIDQQDKMIDITAIPSLRD